jgi:hypothetical protein
MYNMMIALLAHFIVLPQFEYLNTYRDTGYVKQHERIDSSNKIQLEKRYIK